MLVTPETNTRNRRHALALAGFVALAFGILGFAYTPLFACAILSAPAYRLARRRCLRRMRVMATPFPPDWEIILQTRVAYFNALDDAGKERFRKLVRVFLDETRITGIGTDVDELCAVLVAASAIVPVFGFPDWEYAGLGEVLIYPSAFGGEDYGADDGTDGDGRNTVGLVHSGGVMILSKPDLIAGFASPKDKRNVGFHEFAHLVDKADGAIDGLPPGVPAEAVRPWIEWVGAELAVPPKGKSHINPYAYTNEAEYFAVLTEYFFEAPDVLERKNPEMYRMLQGMFHQDTKKFLSKVSFRRPKKLGRNSRCPCGSGKKYKKCCLRRTRGG